MATLRAGLDRAGFDWANGKVFYQAVIDDKMPGWARDEDLFECVLVAYDHEVFDRKYDSSYGAPECPRFVAFDLMYVYFPSNYDGSTRIAQAPLSPAVVLANPRDPTPYPGGG